MRIIHVNNVPDDVYDLLEEQAEREDISLSNLALNELIATARRIAAQ